MNQRLYRTFAAPVAAAFLHAVLAPSFVAAQGFEFEEDEAMDFSEPMEFGEEEVEDGWEEEDLEEQTEDGWGDDGAVGDTEVALDTVTGLIVPSDTLAPALADQLTAVLLSELGNVPGAGSVVGNDALRQEFEIMGAELAYECAFDPVCLGRYGQRLGLGRIVVGRVGETPDGAWATTIDLFETSTSSITNYRYFETEPRTLAVQEALPAQLRQLFGIREERVTGGGRTGPSTAQVAMAWTTAGLALGAFATGVVFGISARNGEKDLEDCRRIDTWDEGQVTCEFTQVEAEPMIDDAKSDALLANVLMGSGLFLGVVSVLLFTITPGGDIDEDADTARRRDWRLAPTATRDGFGVSGAWTF